MHYPREAYTGRGLLLEDAQPVPASTPVHHHPLQDFADDFVNVAERSNRYFANLVGEGGGRWLPGRGSLCTAIVTYSVLLLLHVLDPIITPMIATESETLMSRRCRQPHM